MDREVRKLIIWVCDQSEKSEKMKKKTHEKLRFEKFLNFDYKIESFNFCWWGELVLCNRQVTGYITQQGLKELYLLIELIQVYHWWGTYLLT